jgi:hypothetical protein
MSFKKFYNILYFNIFRFHCFCIYAFLALIGLRENWDDYSIDDVFKNPKGGTSLFLAARFIGTLDAAFVFTFWNAVCAFLRLDIYTWKYGVIFLGVAAVVANFVFHHEHLRDFKEFRSWSAGKNRKFAIITLLVISGIFLAFVGSCALYLAIAISNKP